MDTTIPTIPTMPVQRPAGKKKGPLIAIIVIIVLLLVVGFFVLRKSKKNSQTESTITVTQEPTPTEKPKVDKQTVTIQVLNGTGTPGQAGNAVDALKKAGYNADNIKTANASDYTHTVTTIAAKSGFEDTVSDIKSALSSAFDTINIDSTPLGPDGQFDIVVTTGGKLYQTPTPNATVAPTSSSPTDTPTPTNTPIPTSTPTPTTSP